MTNDDLKTDKQKRLLDSGFKLFTENGIVNTSIQNIVDQAKMAKGTFYLYFKDKYDILNKIILKKSNQIFSYSFLHMALIVLHHSSVIIFDQCAL